MSVAYTTIQAAVAALPEDYDDPDFLERYDAVKAASAPHVRAFLTFCERCAWLLGIR